MLSLIRAIFVCGQQNLAVRGHADSGDVLDLKNDENYDGNFRSILRLMMMCGDEDLKNHITSQK